MTQEQALSILKTGANVFLTGEPGSGKTYTINQYVKYLRDRKIEPAITASTGIAATHIGGMTIHSWSGIGIRTSLNKTDLDHIAASRYITKRVRRAKILLIEEISMLSEDTLAMIEMICRRIKNSPEPFGGMQVVFSGDFFQLPPIQKNDPDNPNSNAQLIPAAKPSARFAYNTDIWKKANLMVCYLTEQHRQEDGIFLDLLSAIRSNVFNENDLSHLQSRRTNLKNTPINIPKLFSHNADVDQINNEMLSKLPGDPRDFSMSSRGSEILVSILKKGCLSPEILRLKAGAAVMFTKNNPKEKFINGTLGEVERFNGITGCPVVRTRTGRKIEVKPMEWTIEENGKTRALVSQLPLRLAWAITIHKSQGMSLDEAVMDLSGVFESGQGYVALSRVRKLSGLHLLGWNEKAFRVSEEALATDKSFRQASREAERGLVNLSPKELEKKQTDFIAGCGGKVVSNISAPMVSFNARNIFAEIRKKHPNAYMPWGPDQDAKLVQLYAAGTSVPNLAKEFGRKMGAIRSRLVKLGLEAIDPSRSG